MKSMVLLLLVVMAIVGAKWIPLDKELDEHWQNFKKAFNKSYSGYEELSRRIIWEQIVIEVFKHNLEADVGLHSYKKGLNEFSDQRHEDFVKTHNGYKMSTKPRNGTTWMPPHNVQLPDKVDWRDEGLVTPVKNQEDCGSCWAFSATGSLESQNKKKTGLLKSLSEQNLVDCSKPFGNYGCDGGNIDYAFKYIKYNGGIDTEESYPYTARDGDCKFKREDIGATCTGYVYIPSGDESALMEAVATVGPTSVAIDASQPSFMNYDSGIYNEPSCSSRSLDHAVLVVGYGSEDGIDYWLVKNSWGTTWGLNGYIKMSRNKRNQCGIATSASYPLV